jgi:hypothetical protein
MEKTPQFLKEPLVSAITKEDPDQIGICILTLHKVAILTTIGENRENETLKDRLIWANYLLAVHFISYVGISAIAFFIIPDKLVPSDDYYVFRDKGDK